MKPRDNGIIWCDASDIATGVLLEIDSQVVEDAAWLRKKDDCAHINIAELDAVIRGVSLAVNWGLKKIKIFSDSATVVKWLSNTLSQRCTLKSNGMSELLIKRRLGIFVDLVEAFSLSIQIRLIKSSENKADILTRVPSRWLRRSVQISAALSNTSNHFANSPENQEKQIEKAITEIHEIAHFGVHRTAYFVHQRFPSVDHSAIQKVVRQCRVCNSIDPAAPRIKHGKLSVEKLWQRIAVDVTHYNQEAFLSVIDCGPSRFTIWRQLVNEEALGICRALDSVFREHGPPEEVLADNGTPFRSKNFQSLCEKWAIQIHYRAAYKPEGNGIVERIHRTIKRIAARTGKHLLEAVFWYNVAPKDRENKETCPANQLYNYNWRSNLQKVEPNKTEVETSSEFSVGDRIFLKPPGARCSTRWEEGTVTKVNSKWNIEVDGIPRHASDLRRIPTIHNHDEDESSEEEDDNEDVENDTNDEENEDGQNIVESESTPRYPQRERRRPDYFIND